MLLIVVWMQGSVDPALDGIDFNRDIRPILSNRCYQCHGPDEASLQAELRLDSFAGATADLGGYAAIVPGEIADSELINRVCGDDDNRMPPAENGPALTKAEIETLRRWIKSGAVYDQHWSYQAPRRPEFPVDETGWSRNPIDQLILEKMSQKNLSPSPEADRYSLVRRVALDLTGLPPAPAEVNEFVEDHSDQAFENMVDRFMAKSSFGERWASMWLDQARYADSMGYAEDRPRTIWAYRDYVIRSFNDNKSFDQFTIEQLAGDLLPNPTDEQVIATAFHRNTLTNTEGGTIDEEFRSAAVADRVNTTMAVWMGTTMACAQCHTHKYDPLTQSEYYQLYAFFNQTQDHDQPEDEPLHRIYDGESHRHRVAIGREIESLRQQLQDWKHLPADQRQTAYSKAQRNWERQLRELIRVLHKTDRFDVDQQQLDSCFALEYSPEVRLNRELETATRRLESVAPTTTVPIMRELAPANQRETRIHHRGNYLDLGDLVSMGTPTTFHPLADGNSNRLDLARWLVSNDNPLTARVTVNRLWQQLFGNGLVASSEDFGTQGDLPTHPELLDYLACEFMERGWDIQSMLKLMITSATYRQQSNSNQRLLELDPANRWLARGPRSRLTAEMVRDQALYSSGLLNPQMYGPPVQPPQPQSGLKIAFRAESTDWIDSVGPDRYRRAIYTRWQRSNPYPSMATFDVSSRDVCELQRIPTNTPLQALVTLNDPAFVEAAQGLARRIMKNNSGSKLKATQALATQAFQLVLTRPPRPDELAELIALFDRTKRKFELDRQAAIQLATDPLNPVDDQTDLIELAAWTTVANVILNLDESFVKP